MALYRDVNVRISSDSYVFSSPSSPDAPSLVVDRPTGDLRLEPGAQASARRVSRVTSIAGILGIVQLRLDKYVIIITKSRPVGRLRGQTVYRVVSTELLPLRERAVRDPGEDEFVAMLQRFLTGPMYFSYAVDLTNSLQRQAHADQAQPLWMRADDRFFWNRFVQSDLVEMRMRGSRASPGPQPAVDSYILPVIFGMLEIRPTAFKGTPLTITLISRRSRHRGGTRYFTRGLDPEGHAANYNETEQIVTLNDAGPGGYGGGGGGGGGAESTAKTSAETTYYSYVQTRGSIPTFWAEINSLKYTPRLQIKPVDAAVDAARRHFDEQIRIYGDNYLVNLVNQTGRESRAKQSYEDMIEKLVSAPREHTEADAVTDEKFKIISHGPYDRLHYIYFDYHHETKGLRIDRANLLVDRLAGALQAQGYFSAVETLRGLEPRSFQTSVVRTNCMDCLDRTNVVQSMLARHMLDRVLAECALSTAAFNTEDPAFEFLFRNLWADNADVVSGAYAGTGAMKTDVTRMGVRTKAGVLQDARIGVTRYFLNNFFDGPRQDSFDLFLGVYRPGSTALLALADRRPVSVQAVPYLLFFSLVMVVVGACARPSSLAVTLFVVVWAAVAVWAGVFIANHGMLYVNWPRLAPRAFAQDGFEEHYAKASTSLLGPLVGHARGPSMARFSGAEEGKKRIE